MTRSRDVSAVQNNLGVAIPPMSAGKNAVINGGMDIWQRGTSISLAASTSAANGYNTDRWCASTGTNQACTISRQAVSDSTNLPNIRYATRFQRNSGQTGTGVLYFSQSIETANSIPFAGRTVTLSFYARAGANYSASSSALLAYLAAGTGTDENVLASWTGATYPINGQTATLTTTWQRFTYTGTVASTATELGIYFSFTPTGTASTNDWFEITGVQLELGSSATPFSRAGGTIQGELAACQRYYERVTSDTSYGLFGTAITNNSTTATAFLPFKVTKRITPTALDTSTVGNWQLDDGVNGFVATAIVLAGAYKNTQWGAVTVTSSGMTQYRPCVMASAGSTTAYIGFSSEL